MSDTGAEPHILIGVDPALTVRVWQQFGGRPFILAFNPLGLYELGIPRDRFGRSMIRSFPAEELAGHFCWKIQNHEAMINVRRDLERAREHFGLPAGVPLRTAVAGNHSSMCIVLRAGFDTGCTSLESFQVRSSLRDRKLACVVGAVLEQIGGLELVPAFAKV